MGKLVNTILNLDRRIIYICVLVLVFVPLVNPLNLPFKTTQEVLDAFETVENLKPGDTILISCDYGPSSMPETHPMYIALLHQCFQKGVRPIILTLIPAGPGLALQGLEEVLESEDEDGNLLYADLKNGDDYVFLGYKAGGQAVMLSIGQSYTGIFPIDYQENPTENMQIFRDCPSLPQTGAIFNIASVGMPEFWIPYGSERAGIPMIIQSTAVSTPQYYPYYQAGQADGLVGGMKGSAEYEKQVNQKYPAVSAFAVQATKGLDAQSAVHIFIVLSIILANIAFFMQPRLERAGGSR